MNSQQKTIVKYFGYGSNADLDMMVHMVGREGLKGEPGKLIGYQLCIQKLEDIRNVIPPTSPLKVSAQDLIRKTWGDVFELFIAIPKEDAVTYGTIWDLTPEEVDLVKEWELVEYGMQEEVNAMAMDSSGNLIQVETQAVIDPPGTYDREVHGNDYDRYIADKDKMLREADNSRLSYQEMLNKQKISKT